MLNKKSLLDRIPITKTIKSDLVSIRKSLAEELSIDSVNTAFKNPGDLGQKQSGERITPEDVANESEYTILGTVNGVIIRKNLKTGDISIVAEDPNKVSINSEEDAKKIEALANIAKNATDTSNTSNIDDSQKRTNDINTQQQRQEQKTGVFETIFLDFDTVDKLKPFLDDTSNEDSEDSDEDDEKGEPEDSGEHESAEVENESEEKSDDSVEDDTTTEPNTTQVTVAGDSLATMDPMDTVNAFPDNWQPSYSYSPDEMLAQVRAAQINTGAPHVQAMLDPSVMELPVTRPINQQPNAANMSIKEPIPDDYAFSMGNNPLSIKLSLEIGGN